MDKPLLNQLLDYTVEQGCSDLHIVCNMKPYVRKSGDIVPINEYSILTKDIIENEFIPLLLYTKELRQEEIDEKAKVVQTRKADELYENKQVDISYETKNGNRYRVNIFSQKNNYGIVIRQIASEIPSLFKLGLPDVINDFAHVKDGLILVTGPTGSGKSTTLAALIDLINNTQKKHIITLEDPIEYMHNNKMSIVNQREIGQDVSDFDMAVKAVLREDPDIVLVGEMRDLETISNAIRIAETGHLVFGTLHTVSAAKSIDRMIDVFPTEQQQQIRVQLSSVLQGVVSQRLCPKVGGGRVCASELMIVTDAIRGIIRDGKNISRIDDQITLSKRKLGTQTMDQCLADLFLQNKISKETASNFASDKESLNRMITIKKI